MRRLAMTFASAAVSFGIGHIALAQAPDAAEATVVQRDIDFEPKEVRIRTGGQVFFVNEDRFGHNVYSETPGGEFDVGRQGPNTRIGVPFRRAGTFAVMCRIHPRMAMQIVVQ
jgi:plastocyanin